MARTQSRVTTDHDEIRRWAEERGARPACVRGTGGQDDIGILRLDFPGYSGQQSLQHIDWDEFFEKFDERGLALLYQETTAGGEKSNFNKLVSRETAQQTKRGGSSHRRPTRAARVQISRSKSRRQKSGGTGRSRSGERNPSRTAAHSNRRASASRSKGSKRSSSSRSSSSGSRSSRASSSARNSRTSARSGKSSGTRSSRSRSVASTRDAKRNVTTARSRGSRKMVKSANRTSRRAA